MSTSGYFTNWIDNVALKNWVDFPHSASLVNSTWLADLETYSTLSEIPPAAICATVGLTNRKAQNGIISADNPTFAGVAATCGNVDKVIISNDVTGELMLVFGDVSGLNVTPNGSDIELAWNTCGIAAL